jgi:hypothetical protein
MEFSFWLYVVLGVLIVLGNLLMIGYMILGIIKKTVQAPYISSFDRDIFVMKKHLNLKSGFSLIDL